MKQYATPRPVFLFCAQAVMACAHLLFASSGTHKKLCLALVQVVILLAKLFIITAKYIQLKPGCGYTIDQCFSLLTRVFISIYSLISCWNLAGLESQMKRNTCQSQDWLLKVKPQVFLFVHIVK